MKNLIKYSLSMFQSIFTISSTIIAIAIWLLADSQQYLPNIIAPFTQIHAILLAVIGLFSRPQHERSSKRINANSVYSIILVGLSIYASLNLIKCSIYPWSLLWIVTAIIVFKNLSKRSKKKSRIEQDIQIQNFRTINQSKTFNEQILEEEDLQIPKRKRNICKILAFVIYVLLIVLFTLNTQQIAYYRSQFPILGHTITMKIPNKDQKVTLHYYCSQIQNSKYPTIVLQHGGGANMAGFMPILKQLETQGIKVCIYDRLGYGRSSKLIVNQNLQQKMGITNLMLSHLLRPNEKVIYGGWSAGVELSIAFYYYYPERVDGLIFIDGYPDYLLLEAIQSNASQIRNPHTLLISKIFRFFQPYGIDHFFGKNPIQNATYNQYNVAYYRTGYFWDSQQQEVRFMNSTNELSELGRITGSPLPYPNAKLYLNWPDIHVPLLVMPANKTVQNPCAPQYKVQCQKYIQKCTSQIKKMEIIEGEHDYIMIYYEKVGNVIKQFVDRVIQPK